MKPYYQDKWVTIYHGDCREILPELPKVDLVLTDPPYGIDIAKTGKIGGENATNPKQYIASDWDEERLTIDVINLLITISKYQMIFGGNYIADLLPPSSCWLIWDKRDGMRSNNFADCELIWTSLDKPSRLFSYLWAGMLQGNMVNKEFRYHPTQKPLSLMRWCIKQIDNINTIIDPYMGSGTTIRAAKDLNIISIGIERIEKYCEIAAKRCSQEVMELNI